MSDPSSIPWKFYQNPHFFPEDDLHESTHNRLQFQDIETLDDLRSDLELERRLRQDAETLTRSLSLELAEERRRRANAEAEASRCRDAAYRAVQETDEERRMLKFADALREERVQMKLTEAAIVLEEKMREIAKPVAPRSSAIDCKGRQGRENMQIKKGVKGILESPRTAGKIRSPALGKEKDRVQKSLECQKSQLRVLLRQKNTGNLGVMADSRSLVVR